jgi:hypothetical protein
MPAPAESPLFLTPRELRELTGRAHSHLQADWLRGHAWPFELDADARPRVLRAVLLARLGGLPNNAPSEPQLRLSHAPTKA